MRNGLTKLANGPTRVSDVDVDGTKKVRRRHHAEFRKRQLLIESLRTTGIAEGTCELEN